MDTKKANFDPTGQWEIHQNRGGNATVHIMPGTAGGSDETTIHGTATIPGETANVTGVVFDDYLLFEIQWKNTIGVYCGKLDSARKLSGYTWSAANVGGGTEWGSSKVFPRKQ